MGLTLRSGPEGRVSKGGNTMDAASQLTLRIFVQPILRDGRFAASAG